VNSDCGWKSACSGITPATGCVAATWINFTRETAQLPRQFPLMDCGGTTPLKQPSPQWIAAARRRSINSVLSNRQNISLYGFYPIFNLPGCEIVR